MHVVGEGAWSCSRFQRAGALLSFPLNAFVLTAPTRRRLRASQSLSVGEGVLRPRRPSPGALSRPKQGPDELTRRRSNGTVSGGWPPGAEVFHAASLSRGRAAGIEVLG
jgi:hypothetical protein